MPRAADQQVQRLGRDGPLPDRERLERHGGAARREHRRDVVRGLPFTIGSGQADADVAGQYVQVIPNQVGTDREHAHSPRLETAQRGLAHEPGARPAR